MFDPESDVGRRYLDYLEARARVWAEKYLDGRTPDYRGDAVLQRFHFCNVWRELDRYSRWEISQMRGKPLQRQVDLLVVGRFSMVPKTVELLLGGCDVEQLRAHVAGRKAAKLPWYNPALQIWCKAGSDFPAMFVAQRDGYMANRKRVVDLVRGATSAQAIADALPGMVPSIGPFRGYEIATSLTYSEHLPRLDESQLFHIGPGSEHGLRLLTGSGTATRQSFEVLQASVAKALSRRRGFRWVPPEWQGSLQRPVARKLTLRTLEDSMCEFRKYVALGGGSGVATRRTYRQRDITE